MEYDENRSTKYFFDRNGYAVFRNVIPPEDIARLARSIESDLVSYAGKLLRDSGNWEHHRFGRLPTGGFNLINSLADPHLISGTPELDKLQRRSSQHLL